MSEKHARADCPRGRNLALNLSQGHPRHIMRIILAIAREIFDESAYVRFLSRSAMRSSPEAYAAFLREYDAMRARRPKCC